MKPIHFGILFLVSVLLASITSVSPWAEAVFRVGKYASPWFNQVEETDEKLNIPVYSWDKSLRVDGCPRGSVKGLDYFLDCWIWVGRAMFICQAGLWLIFLFGAAFRKGFKMVAIWSAVLIVIFFLFFSALHPIVECVYIQFPLPLIFAKQWQINIWSTLFCIINIFCGVWINVLIYKPQIRYKAG
jgi:hypothetical protein